MSCHKIKKGARADLKPPLLRIHSESVPVEIRAKAEPPHPFRLIAFWTLYFKEFVDRLKRIKEHDAKEDACKITPLLLNAQGYGSPQSRLRLYFVGLRCRDMVDTDEGMKPPPLCSTTRR